MRRAYLLGALFVLWVLPLLPLPAQAQTCYLRAAANWDINSTWSMTACGGAAAGSFPTNVATYDQNPLGRASFGIHQDCGEVIYMREMF